MDSQQWCAILSIVFLYGALLALVVIWRRSDWLHSTFSAHAATTIRSTLYYFVIFSCSLSALSYVLATYIAPKLHLPGVATAIFTVACLLQIGCTLLPERGKLTAPHKLLAQLSALLLWTFCTYTAWITKDSLLYMLVVLMCIIAIDGVRRSPRYALVYQAVFYTCFFAAYLYLALV